MNLFELFTRGIYVLDSLWLAKREHVWAYSDDIAIFLVHVNHGLSMTIFVGMTKAPEIRERSKKRAWVFLETIMIVLGQ